MRLTLLVLLWIWAACVFLVLDLFFNVDEFAAIRPDSSFYRGMRKVAHDMVGESYDDGTSEPDLVARVEALRRSRAAQVGEALAEARWERAWRLAQKHDIDHIEDTETAGRLVETLEAFLEVSRQDLAGRTQRRRQIEFLKSLLVLYADEGVVERLTRMLGQGRDIETVETAHIVLQRIFEDGPLSLRGDDAFERIGPEIEHMLVGFASSEGRYGAVTNLEYLRGQYAALVLARLGSPRAIEALVRLVRERPALANVLAAVRDPRAVRALVTTLESVEDGHLAAQFAGGLAAIGPAGRAELRRLLGPASPLGWDQQGPVLGACLAALARSVSDVEDLEAIQQSLELVPQLRPTVARIFVQERASRDLPRAIAQFLAARHGSQLEPILLEALSAYDVGDVDPILNSLEASRPGTRAKVVALRKASSGDLQGIR